ncbi:MAG: hypothetical protein R3F13_13490 [Prosthecobacter sp.]
MTEHLPNHWSRRRAMLAAMAACCGSSLGQESAPHVRILFFGTSYTALNGLPAMVGELLLSSGLLAPHIGSYLQPGYRLEQHSVDQAGLGLLRQGADDGQPWDVIVAQEQSLLSAAAASKDDARRIMNGGLAGLVASARGINPGMLVVDFQVWARHQDLWGKNSKDALFTGTSASHAMDNIRAANVNAVTAARQQSLGAQILISPVGDFWQQSLKRYPGLKLHAENGSHPAIAGSYLAALVIAGTIGGRGVIEKATWNGECPAEDAERLRKLVLDHPEIFKEATP